MRLRSSLFIVGLILIATATGSLAQAGKPAGAGAATPQEAVAVLQKATAPGQVAQSLTVISPKGLKQLANDGVSGVLMVLAFSDPDDPMPGGPKLSKTALDAKRKQYKAAVDLAAQTLKPHGLDTLIGKPAMAPETQKALDAALDKADNLTLITSLYAALVKMGPMLGMNKDPDPRPLVKLGTVTAYKINGDKATAQNDANPIEFVRINGRWYVEPPAEPGAGGPPSSGGSSGSSASTGSQAGTAAPVAERATASGKDPEVVIGGVQIAKVVVPDNEFSAKPFHADNGTTIVLWVKLPAGQGLIEIDDDTSTLLNVGDDKGSSLGGKYGSFPEEFKDGSGGIIEIKSSGFPAPGSTAITVDGTLSMTVSTGTRKTRVPKVTLANNGKFTLGKTPIVIAELQAQDDSQSFTLKLPRQLMTEIKNVVFLDAKGEPIEGSRTSSGYMNDAAEAGFTIKTTAKIVTLEFEMWQGLKTIKVPFKLKAGLGLE